MKLCLVETARPHERGSMKRYADLIEKAFAADDDVEVQRACVAPEISRFPGKLQTLAHHVLSARNARKLAKSSDADIFHVIDGSRGYLAQSLKMRKVVVTVHDVIPKLQSQGRFDVPPPGRLSRLVIDRAIGGLSVAAHLVFDSESSRNDYYALGWESLGGDSIVFPPLEPSFFSVAPSTTAQKDPYIFHIGNNGFYKNRSGVIEIFGKIASKVPHRLVMAGPPPASEVIELTQRLQIADRVDFVNYPSDDEVLRFYQTASLLLFPSLYEGFGWPPIEAMACGCPVVCSDAGSLDEVVGDAALKRSPDDLQGMANDALLVLTDDAVALRMMADGLKHASKFTLARFADELRDVYRAAMEGGNNTA